MLNQYGPDAEQNIAKWFRNGEREYRNKYRL